MKKQLRWILNIILTITILFAGIKFILTERENYRSQQDYDQAMQVAGAQHMDEALPEETVGTESTVLPDETVCTTSDDPIIQELLEINLDALREENEDVIGWICIPDTNVNYPLLQWTDNDFYLNHTWNQSQNSSGAIFMEYQNKPDFSEFNTIIYGHNMRNDTMFGSLPNYRGATYRQKHPYVYIVNDFGVLRYDVFAAQSASIKSIIFGLGIEAEQRKEEFLRFIRDYSPFELEIIPTAQDRILTLSTCSGTGSANRWVVLSVLNEEASFKRPDNRNK